MEGQYHAGKVRQPGGFVLGSFATGETVFVNVFHLNQVFVPFASSSFNQLQLNYTGHFQNNNQTGNLLQAKHFDFIF